MRSLSLTSKFLRILLLLAAGWCAGLAVSAAAQEPLALPAYATVVDPTGMLVEAEAAALAGKLRAFEKTYGPQVAVVLLASTKPEPLEDYANRLANTWKLGREGIGDGVVIVLARDDRQIRVEVSRALEGALPDVVVGRILTEVMMPSLKQGDIAGGLVRGVDALIAHMTQAEGSQVSTPSRNRLEVYLEAHKTEVAWTAAGLGGTIFVGLMGLALAKVGGVLAGFFLVVIGVLAGITGRQYQLHANGTGGTFLLVAFVFFTAFFAWGLLALVLLGRRGDDGGANAGPTRHEPSSERDDRDDTGSSDDRSGGGGDYAGGGATGRW
ncbi:MAG: TPM domain-containing protein [Rhizobacter sp.]|nr:TPM domain-containing protein [Rhizobacter sp.]